MAKMTVICLKLQAFGKEEKGVPDMIERKKKAENFILETRHEFLQISCSILRLGPRRCYPGTEKDATERETASQRLSSSVPHGSTVEHWMGWKGAILYMQE